MQMADKKSDPTIDLAAQVAELTAAVAELRTELHRLPEWQRQRKEELAQARAKEEFERQQAEHSRHVSAIATAKASGWVLDKESGKTFCRDGALITGAFGEEYMTYPETPRRTVARKREFLRLWLADLQEKRTAVEGRIHGVASEEQVARLTKLNDEIATTKEEIAAAAAEWDQLPEIQAQRLREIETRLAEGRHQAVVRQSQQMVASLRK
jgi:hypothetical protein